jgi:hypothetical protein
MGTFGFHLYALSPKFLRALQRTRDKQNARLLKTLPLPTAGFHLSQGIRVIFPQKTILSFKLVGFANFATQTESSSSLQAMALAGHIEIPCATTQYLEMTSSEPQDGIRNNRNHHKDKTLPS